MTSEPSAGDCWPCQTHRAVRRFSEVAHGRIARKIVARLQRQRASGIFGDDIHPRSVWDEYCYEAQEGPHEQLTAAWDQLLIPIIDFVIGEVPHEDAVLLSIGAAWELGEHDLELGDGASFPELIRDNVRRHVHRIAADRPMARVRHGGRR